MEHLLRRKWPLLILGVMLCGILWNQKRLQGQNRLKVVLVALTQASASSPLRHPFFVRSTDFTRDQNVPSTYVVWNRGIIDNSVPGRKYFEPRRTTWISWDFAPYEANSTRPAIKTWQSFCGAASSVAPDSVVVNTKDIPLLLQQSFQGSVGRSGANLFILDLNRLIMLDYKIPSWNLGLLSVLPYHGKDSNYLSAYRNQLEKQQAEAAKLGKKVYVSPLYLGPSAMVATEEELRKLDADIRNGDVQLVNPPGISVGDRIFSPEQVPTDIDYSRCSGIQEVNGHIWLTGIDRNLANTDTPQDYLWVIKSGDGGKSWGARSVIARGNFPEIIATASGGLQVFYTDVDQFGWQGKWPEDVPPIPAEKRRDWYHWPGRGPLRMIRSRDDGKTWSKPETVVSSEQVIQSSACVGPDGRIYLVYVESDPDPRTQRRASLWLTSSIDSGATWSKPSQITDGKYLDREPDTIYHDGKLLVAFSRAGRGINTNIYVAEVEIK